MDTQSELIFLRMKLHDLIEQHPNWSNYRLSDELGKSESWIRKWRNRFREAEQESFEMYQSQSCAPKTIWRETPLEVKKVVAQLRVELSEQYHRTAGPRLILHELRKREDLKDAGHYVPNSDRTITKILNELGYIYRPKKYERVPLILPAPMEEWEMDFGQIRIDRETIFEFFLVVDRGTSRVVYLEGCEGGYNAETTLEAFARLFTICGLPQRLRIDRDSRLVGSWTRDSYPSALIRFLRVLAVESVVCPPRRPDLKPVVERCVSTLKHE